jgi:Site-specific recombinase XerD
MKGTVRKRKYRSGRISWAYEIDCPRDQVEERVRITRSGFRTQGEALEALSKEVASYSEGRYVRRSRQTLAQYLETWLTEHADSNLVGKTTERYRELVEKYIAPRIGHIPLQELDPFQLERMYADLRKKGGLRGKPLSPRTVQQIHAVINSALNRAVRWKQLVVNPAKACELPKREHRDVIMPDESDTKLILESLKSTELYLVALIAAHTGMRRGEILALAWACIDFDANVMKVSRSLQETRAGGLKFKTPKSRKPREFPFSSVLRNALLAHRTRQEANRQLFGPDYRAELDLVVCEANGAAIHPDRFSSAYCRHIKKIGKRGMSLHTLRHSHASTLLANGVPVTAVSKRLGHAQVSTTLNIYSHAFSRDELRAAEVMDQVYGESEQPKLIQ